MLQVQCLVLAAYEKRVQDCHPGPWKPRSQQGSERSQGGEAEEPTHMAVGRSLRASSRRSGTQCSSSLQPFQKGTWARERQVWVAGKGTHSLQPVFPVGQPLPSQHTSSSLCGTRHGLWFSCPCHRYRAAFDHGFA